MLKRQDICIRDPFVMIHHNKYYMYGTRSETTWTKAEGFDCYVSDDLNLWEGPYEIFKRDEDFFADQNYWAPECYAYKDKFYLVTTLGANDRKKAVYIMVSDTPTGPFVMHSQGSVTPKEWSAIDGALHFETDGSIYLLFSRTFEDKHEGYMCAVKLSDTLKEATHDPIVLFDAKTAPWPKAVPFAKEAFGIDGEVYFTDGPCSYKGIDNRLYIVWSSWYSNGYAVGVAVSESGKIEGPWKHEEKPLFADNGGHGMIFKTLDGKLMYALHTPNDFTKERPTFMTLVENSGKLTLNQ